MQEMLDILQNKKHATGYFFVVNEIVYPVYTTVWFNCTMQEAWDLICNSWLNDLYKKPVNAVLPYLLRGEIIEGEKLRVGHNVDYYIAEISQVFKISSFSDIEFEKLYEMEEVKPEHRSAVKLVYKYVDYIESLPWSVKLHLIKESEDSESNKILSTIVKQTQNILKAKRLGSQAGVADVKTKFITEI